MILTPYSLIAGFVAVLQFPLGLLVVRHGMRVGRHDEATSRAASRDQGEERQYLLLLLVPVTLSLSLLGWPLLYALLQSYVPEWPSAMCIYGVTRIGAGSAGASRSLPALLSLLQLLKPVLLFAAGSWFVIYRLHRESPDGTLLRSLGVLAVVVGCLLIADAAVQSAYLVIPKRSESLSTGCCTVAVSADRTPVASATDIDWLGGATGLSVLGFALTVGMALGVRRYRAARSTSWAWLPLIAGGAVAALWVNGVFLREVAAPRILGLPYHHCVYDLIPRAPEAIIGGGLFVGATFCVGWAIVAALLGRHAGGAPQSDIAVRRLMRGAQYGYLYSMLLFAVALAIA